MHLDNGKEARGRRKSFRRRGEEGEYINGMLKGYQQQNERHHDQSYRSITPPLCYEEQGDEKRRGGNGGIICLINTQGRRACMCSGVLTGSHKQVAASLPRGPAVMMRRGGAAGV